MNAMQRSLFGVLLVKLDVKHDIDEQKIIIRIEAGRIRQSLKAIWRKVIG